MGEKVACPPCKAIKEACEKSGDPLLCELSGLIEKGASAEAIAERIKTLPKSSVLALLESIEKVVEGLKAEAQSKRE